MPDLGEPYVRYIPHDPSLIRRIYNIFYLSAQTRVGYSSPGTGLEALQLMLL